MTRKNRENQLPLWTFGLIGLVLLSSGGIWGYKQANLWNNGVTSKGTVVGEKQRTSTEHDKNGNSYLQTYYYPVVEFKTPKGTTVRVEGQTGSSHSSGYGNGATIDVLYYEDRPEDAQIKDFEQFWMGPSILGGFGVLCSFAAIGVFFLMKSTGKAFDRPFFAAQSGDLGRFKEMNATITEVLTTRRDDGKSAIIVVCTGTDAVTFDTISFRSPAVSYNVNGRSATEEDTKSWPGKTVRVVYDPNNHAEFYADFLSLLGTTLKSAA